MSKDTIYREDAIKALDTAWINGTSLLDANEAIKRLNDLPSADRPQGEWKLKEHLWECDQCGCRTNRANPLKGNIWNYNFCPNCGADMRGEEE